MSFFLFYLFRHPELKGVHTCSPITLRNSPDEPRIVFGYLCVVCHFVQVFRDNLENHIKFRHPEKVLF